MTNTQSFAAKELDALSGMYSANTTSEDLPLVLEFRDEILALCEKFGKSGQSEDSAPYVALVTCNTLKHLLLQEPICPITGITEEWVDVSEHNDGNPWYQNNRCAGLFRDGNIDMVYYLDAVIFKDQDGITFTSYGGNGIEGITSSQYIKGFPFEPKSFYIDVISTDTNGIWEHTIKNMKQLDKVWKYYKKPQELSH